MRYRPRHCSKLASCPSIQAALCVVRDALASAGVESPGQEASLLVQHVLGGTREAMLSSLQQKPSGEALTRLSACLECRLDGEPLQYVLGEWWFHGRPFFVSPDALIPRPETELLADAAIQVAPAMPRPAGKLLIADIGTGSGVLAITLAEEVPDSEVIASDRSREALRLAAANLCRHAAGRRVQLVQCDLGDPFARRFSGIVANLPYVPSDEMALLPREIRDHEPPGALDGGRDGIQYIRRLISDAPGMLNWGGWLLLEIGCGQADAVSRLMRDERFEDVTALPDLAGIPRVVLGRLGRTGDPAG